MFGANGFFWRSESGGSGTTPAPAGEPRRPRIGLALGGGAARGWAHIGVVRALTEAGLVPDIIAGTSIGAVVGGCYAAGALDELERFARGLTRRRVFGLLDLNFAGSGLISGNRLSKLLGTRLGDLTVEGLRPRFACVATELGTGHEIWLSRGPLVEALRASYALPGIFQPVRVGGRWLVDGALVNPVPVTVARAMGAEFVIAVNLQSDVFGRGTVVQNHGGELPEAAPSGDETMPAAVPDARHVLRRQLIGRQNGPPGISAVMIEAFNIIQDRIARSRLAGDPPDVTIGPKVGTLGLFDFHRAGEAIDIGYESARRATPEIAEVLAGLA
ncbi:MAG: patatin-like phospholipase family protein [Rhizobiales bacterium]|nr:patatin-like phospholipase family protein [Hyphomicrobiales bacterium]